MSEEQLHALESVLSSAFARSYYPERASALDFKDSTQRFGHKDVIFDLLIL